jgi:hypothetical protein
MSVSPGQVSTEGARNELRDARRVVDLGGPLGHRTEHGAEVDLLERLAAARLARDLTDEHDERRGILLRDVDAGGRSARREADAGTAGELADRLRHHGGAALLPAHRDRDIAIVERIERRQIALARHAEGMPHPVKHQLVDQDLAAGA